MSVFVFRYDSSTSAVDRETIHRNNSLSPQDSQPWKLPGLQATVRLAWALALRGISQLPDVTGKLLVGHFLMRNDVSAFNISEKV